MDVIFSSIRQYYGFAAKLLRIAPESELWKERVEALFLGAVARLRLTHPPNQDRSQWLFTDRKLGCATAL